MRGRVSVTVIGVIQRVKMSKRCVNGNTTKKQKNTA